MSQHYSNPKRVEVFYWSAIEAKTLNQMNGNANPEDENYQHPGWYWQSCFPGCLPDSDPIGPFETHGAALVDAQANADDDSDDDTDTDDGELPLCAYCSEPFANDDSDYCSNQCAIDAEKERE